MSRASLTVEIGKMQNVVDERDAEIKRLKSRNVLLEAVYLAVKNWPESERTMALRYALGDMKDR